MIYCIEHEEGCKAEACKEVCTKCKGIIKVEKKDSMTIIEQLDIVSDRASNHNLYDVELIVPITYKDYLHILKNADPKDYYFVQDSCQDSWLSTDVIYKDNITLNIGYKSRWIIPNIIQDLRVFIDSIRLSLAK